MHGFIAIISKDSSKVSISWKEPIPLQGEFKKQNLENNDYRIEQYTSLNFLSEKHWIDTDDFIFITEGIILNLSFLFTKYHVKDTSSLLSVLYQNEADFFKKFEGNFVGLFYDKKGDNWFFFNNQTGTKKLYYYHNKQHTIVSTDSYTLKRSLDKLQIPTHLDVESSYLLLTSGFMNDNKTLVQEIKQVRAGEYIQLDEGRKLTCNFYFHLNQISHNNKDSKSDIIHQLDLRFKNAVKLEYEVKNNNQSNHITTISGGLDSRMTALIAWHLGYKDQHLINFSQKGYADEIIARKIASEYKLPLTCILLSADSLEQIDDVIRVNNGEILYSGASHVLYAINQLNNTSGAIIHTGMIGDAVLGSFVANPDKDTMPLITSGTYSQTLLPKVQKTLEASITNYRNEEIYKFYNRAFLGANNGFLYLNLIGESFSPFLNTDFLSYAFSIPNHYKYKEAIYIDWIKTLYPDIARFKWEAIGGKPTNNKMLKEFYRYKRAVIKRLPIKSMWKHNMTPEQHWYNSEKEIRNTLDSYFELHIDLVDDKELKEDLIFLYQKGSITEKTQAITLLGAIKLLFCN